MADESSVARLEAEVAALLQQIPTAAGNSEQLELLRRAQEIALHRDASGDAHRLLHTALPFLQTLLHQQNAPLVAAILTFLSEAARRSRLFLCDLFDAVATVLLLSYSSEKNVLKALDLATAALLDAFQFVAAPTSASAAAPSHEQLRELWTRVSVAIDHVAELAFSSPINLLPATPSDNNNRSAAVFLRAWKLLDRAILVLTEAREATVYRDPARSNVLPDAVTIDLLPTTESPLSREQLVEHGDALLRRLIDRILTPADGVAALTRRELCVALNSLSLVAALRPQHLSVVIPALIACQAADIPGASDRAVQATIKANLVKLLSQPAAQELAEEVTECVIALGDGERAFRAISKSKDPRRMYVTAPSEASLRRARIGKRTAEQISEAADHKPSIKRSRSSISTTSTAASTPDRITPEVLVNMPSSEVLNLVLSGFESELPAPPPRNLVLLLPPTELKARMTSLLARVATPSSVLALETSIRRSRDPRRRRESHDGNAHQQPSLLPVFDDETADEVGDWMSKNSTTVEEPLVSLAEDNSVQVFLKPVSAVWCRDMAAAALSRILENEYGGSIRGDDALREALLCRLASSPWFLLTDDRNAPITINPSLADTKLPPVYQTILDFVLEDIERRASLASELLHHEYVRVTKEMVHDSITEANAEAGPPKTGDVIYRKAVNYLLSTLLQRLDLSSSSEKKLFGGIVTQLPRVTVDVLRVTTSLFTDPHKSSGGAVLGITVLRDLIRDRKACEDAALRVLLRYTCDGDETCRNSSIRCVANQLYVIDGLKKPIEQYAIQLVKSLEEGSTQPSTDASSSTDQEDATMDESEAKPSAAEGQDTTMEETAESAALRSPWLRERLMKIQEANRGQAAELQEFAQELDRSASNLSSSLDTEIEILRRLELYLALCAKKPALLGHLITTYGRASELARQVIFQAIEKLIKHLKQRSNGSNQVVAQLRGFEAPALGLVCHIIQILATRSTSTSSSKSATDEANANAELVNQILALWQSHTHIPDGISVLIPVISSIAKDTLLPLLPTLLSLPQNRWSVAITRVLEAMPPQVLTPIDLLIALHHVDLKVDAGMQKKVIMAINFCMENRHAFPAEVLLHVCRVLLQEEHISKLALRTLILSVTTHPALQQDAAHLLRGLVDRCVWEMQDEGDALWKGFVKCAALIQPASFPVLLDSTKFPVAQLEMVLQDEPTLRGLMREFVASPEVEGSGLKIGDDVRALLAEGADEDEAVKESKTKEAEAETAEGAEDIGDAEHAADAMEVDDDAQPAEVDSTA